MAGKPLRKLAEELRHMSDRELLVLAIFETRRNTLALERLFIEDTIMAGKFASVSDALTGLQKDVQDEETVKQSVVTLITGIPSLIAAAVAVALAAGATPEQLQAFSDLSDSIEAKNTDFANAVVTGTPAADPGTGATGGTAPAGGGGTAPAGGTG